MRNSLQIARIFGIPIKIHISFLFVLPFFAWIFAQQPEPYGFAGVGPDILRYALAFATAILLFASVLVHELAHSYLSLRYGTNVREISLYLIGGVSAIEGQLTNPVKEATMAFAGPFSSLIMGVFLLGVNYILNPAVSTAEGSAIFLVIFILGYINVILAMFNLIPAFPMDGGRILRALLATRMGFVEATEKAATVGKILAIIMGIIGLLISFWLVLIAIFIYMGATGEEKQVKSRYSRY
ncbi:MAG: site-2 protease family protein [Methanolobus sp.]|uniref:site-2 protease family protein n=1 Tax=Methanolobus sp. TaxID=1874737 RepID=UPI0027301CD0|nr:site-2 protease family protein [Methanolobus sp.]MDP2217075.1 site-2 protease family protein [Methanolobus sp.]